MTEDEARSHAQQLAPGAMPRLERYADLLLAENASQNLIARSTEPAVWQRHLLDALQLVRYVRPEDRLLLDVGSGAGIPGLVLGMLGRWQVTLVEPRRRRVEFLRSVIEALRLDHVEVVASNVEAVACRHDLITARAVASSDQLFALTRGCADDQTRFVLPKGRSARTDVDLARRRWQGLFHVEQSLTDPEAGIVIADRVTRR